MRRCGRRWRRGNTPSAGVQHDAVAVRVVALAGRVALGAAGTGARMSEWEHCRRCGEGVPSIPGTYCEPCFDVLAAEYGAEMQAEYEAAGMPWPPRDCDLAAF
jgi:hypothetical protein